MSSELLGTFYFDAASQQEFARLSGDWNPIHVDPVHARRTQVGALTVHGIHIVCRCLEALADKYAALPEMARLTARFEKPTFVGDRLAIVLVERTDSQFRIQARAGDVVTMQLTLQWAGGMPEQHVMPSDLRRSDDETPRERSFTEIAAAKGRVASAVTPDEICRPFAGACRWAGGSRVAALLCISRVVGMDCPGFYSLLAGFDLDCSVTPSGSDVSYVVVKSDERLRTVKMAVEGLGVRGIVDTFLRRPPVRQPSFSEVAARVEPNEFEGQSALVVGGSRGLGELTSKIIAAGGGHPILTYSVGEKEAECVQTEIIGSGAHCDVLRYDVRLPAKTQLEQLRDGVAYLYYFATCSISRRTSQACDAELLNEFLQFYVHGFQELCLALMPLALGQLSVFSPSSIFLDKRPTGFTEYVMAKAACEVMCEDLMRQFSGLKIFTSRLPRLQTDQTSSFVPAKFPDALETLLPVIRKVHSRKPPTWDGAPVPNNSNNTRICSA